MGDDNLNGEIGDPINPQEPIDPIDPNSGDNDDNGGDINPPSGDGDNYNPFDDEPIEESGTPFVDVITRMHTTLRTDYRMDKLYSENPSIFLEYMVGFLQNSIDMFDGALENLSYHTIDKEIKDENDVVIDTETLYYFDRKLSSKEIYILALGVSLGIYRKDIDDVSEYSLHLTSKEFKAYSEANNLSKRLDRYNAMKEEFYDNINSYQLTKLSNIPFFRGD